MICGFEKLVLTLQNISREFFEATSIARKSTLKELQ